MTRVNPLRRLPLGLPQLLGLVVVLISLPWLLLTGKSEREIRQAIESFEPFRVPEFPLRFSRTIEYDPLGFLGRGVQAGFWKWTPEGMVLEEKGRAYFAETRGEIASVVGTGRRVISNLEGFQDREGRRDVRFRYHWTEVTSLHRPCFPNPPCRMKNTRGAPYWSNAPACGASKCWRLLTSTTPSLC